MLKKFVLITMLLICTVTAQNIPNVTGTDYHGTYHDMYKYFKEGKHVALFFTGSF